MSARAGLRTLLLALVLLALVAALLVIVQITAARYADLRAPTLSQQVAARPPLQDVVQDQGSTVALPDGRTLWIFADTAKVTGRPQFFVTSSAALADGDELRIRYLSDRAGTPIEFLPRTTDEKANQVPGEHYTAVWPTGSTTLPDGRIIIAYAKYRVNFTPEARFDFVAGGLFQYRFAAGANPVGAAPATRLADDLWTAADGPVASPVYADGYVYFYRCEDFTCYALRTTPAGLADRRTYTWRTADGWSVDPGRRAKVAFGSDVPGRNPSIGYSSALGVFTMADTSGGIQSRRGVLWVAHQPWGPWSRAARFPLPECPSGGCYTLNVHPQQSAEGYLRVSFATNGLGPYVRVVDVPIRVDATADPPTIRTQPD